MKRLWITQWFKTLDMHGDMRNEMFYNSWKDHGKAPWEGTICTIKVVDKKEGKTKIKKSIKN